MGRPRDRSPLGRSGRSSAPSVGAFEIVLAGSGRASARPLRGGVEEGGSSTVASNGVGGMGNEGRMVCTAGAGTKNCGGT